MMKERGAILVATRHIQESLLLDHGGFPPPVVDKIEKLVPLTRKNYDLAVKCGVKIALGTDMWNSNPTHPISHGKNAMELTYARAAGMTALQAIEAMTATPPEVLGKQAPQSGQLKAGYDADVIGVAGNPLDDLSYLTNASNVTHVVSNSPCSLFSLPTVFSHRVLPTSVTHTPRTPAGEILLTSGNVVEGWQAIQVSIVMKFKRKEAAHPTPGSAVAHPSLEVSPSHHAQ